MRLQLFDNEDLSGIESALTRSLTKAFSSAFAFDDETIKGFENLFVRAMIRASRVIAREAREEAARQAPTPVEPVASNELTAEQIAAEEMLGLRGTPTIEIVVTPPPAPAPQAPVAVTLDQFAAQLEEVVRPLPPMTKVTEVPAGRKKPTKARSPRDVCKTVATRPNGYITTDEARDIIGRDAAGSVALSVWVLNKEIPAVIVAGVKPPTKGLPGRLMVDKRALVERNKIRLDNWANGKGRRREHFGASPATAHH